MNAFTKSVWENVSRPLHQRTKKRQVAALCHRGQGNNKQVLLITSRGTGRWIIPKGWPIRGLDDRGAALQEAWEEAGVRNSTADPDPIGTFTYNKVQPTGASIPIEAFVYAVAVEDLAEDFPEAQQRRRKWMSPQEAAARVQEDTLKSILRDI